MTTRRRQAGVGFLGFLVLAALVGFGALVLMKLFPLYNESFKVTSAMKAVAGRVDIAEQSPAAIRDLMLRNFEVQDLDDFNAGNIRQHLVVAKAPTGQGRVMTFTYERRTHLVGNLDVVLNFQREQPLAGSDVSP